MPVPTPPIEKSTLMRLIEERDPLGRDVRQIVFDLYDQRGTTAGVVEGLEELLGKDARLAPGGAGVYKWMTRDWGWSLERTIRFPAAEREEVRA